VGKISKQWAGALRELFTDADYFGITCKSTVQPFVAYSRNPVFTVLLGAPNFSHFASLCLDVHSAQAGLLQFSIQTG